MNIASTPDEGATPLLSSSDDQQINEVPNTTGEKSLATNNEDNAEPSREARHSQPYSIDGGISALSLAMIIFYNVTGGPFGIEPTVKAAGNFYAIIGIALMPFVWAIPEMYMTYKLSALYPCASGGVLWCGTAYGPSFGLMQGYLGWLGGVINAATFPALLYEYIMSQFYPDKGESEVNPLIRYGFLLLLVVLMTLINYRGLDFVGKASTSIYIISMSAFVVMTVIGIPKIDPEKWLQTPEPGINQNFDDDSLSTNGWLPVDNLGGIEFRVLINTLYWNFNNFDQASHYSASVPKKVFKKGLSISLLLASSAYLIPVLVATGATDIVQAEWKAGTFAVAGTEIGGQWLGTWIVISSAISVIASFNSELAADSMQLMGMSDRAQIPSVFSHRSPFGTPTYSIVLCLIVILSVLPLQFGLIVELTNFAYVMSVAMEFMAFVKLQIIDADYPKLRKVSYAIMITPPMVFNIIVMLLASYATYIYAAIVICIGFMLIHGKSMSNHIKKCLKSRRNNVESSSSIGTLDKSVA